MADEAGSKPPGGAPHCGIPATGPQPHASEPACRLESVSLYRLSMDSKLDMVNSMEVRGTAGKRAIALLALGLGVLLSGCMQQTIEPSSDANFTARDRK